MDWLPDAPGVVLLALTLAAALFLIEVALPTVGVAGTASLVLGAWAVAIVGHQGYAWWPLLFVVTAVCVWAVLLARKRATIPSQVVAAGLFAAGGATYGALADDPASVALSVGGAIALAAGFPSLLRATTRLLNLPAMTGMAALVDRSGTVVSWSAGTGQVRLDGTLWNACGPESLAVDAVVIVRGYRGMTVDVALPAPIT